MSRYFKQLERELLGVLGSLPRLDRAEAEEVRMYLDAGEYGLCLETICATLQQAQRPISAETYVNIVDLGERMGIEPACWLAIEVE
jgi:hypothetical protein